MELSRTSRTAAPELPRLSPRLQLPRGWNDEDDNKIPPLVCTGVRCRWCWCIGTSRARNGRRSVRWPARPASKICPGQFARPGGRPTVRTVANRLVLASPPDRNRNVPRTFCRCRWMRDSSTSSSGNPSANKARFAEVRLAGSLPGPRYSGCGENSESVRPSTSAP